MDITEHDLLEMASALCLTFGEYRAISRGWIISLYNEMIK